MSDPGANLTDMSDDLTAIRAELAALTSAVRALQQVVFPVTINLQGPPEDHAGTP